MSTARQSNQSAGHMAQLEAEREEDFVVTDEPLFSTATSRGVIL